MDGEFKAQFQKLIVDVEAIKGLCTETNSELKTVKADIAILKEADKNQESRIEKLEREMMEVRKENSEIKKENLEIKKENAELKMQQIAGDQYSRKANVIINGVPVTNGEKLRQVVGQIADQLGIKLERHHFCAVHRLKSDKEIPPIIARFNDYEVKFELIRRAKVAKLTGDKFGWGPQAIYVDEQLAPGTAQLLRGAKELCKAKKAVNAWVYEGKVFLREKEDKPPRLIQNPLQLVSRNTQSNKRNVESPDIQEPQVAFQPNSQLPRTPANKKAKSLFQNSPSSTRGVTNQRGASQAANQSNLDNFIQPLTQLSSQTAIVK